MAGDDASYGSSDCAASRREPAHRETQQVGRYPLRGRGAVGRYRQEDPKETVMSIAARTQDLVIEADERGRVSLARAGVQPHQRFVVHLESDGSVILSPATVVTAHEARFLQNTQLVEQIEDDRAHPERLKKVDRKVRRRG